LTRILLISGDGGSSEESLRRRILRFTGSRRATRTILQQLAAARMFGEILSCMILPTGSDESSWEVRVSFARPGLGG
jgi:hypothetical protein